MIVLQVKNLFRYQREEEIPDTGMCFKGGACSPLSWKKLQKNFVNEKKFPHLFYQSQTLSLKNYIYQDIQEI